MPASAASSPSSVDLHDSPTSRAIQAVARQAQRARRAETVRLRQRAALLELLVQTMAELHISMAELNAARRAHAPAWKHPEDGTA
ncbi:hypothetical protein [Variovorax sp. PAMC26660]|uniref:hypothetical protein n=1 Tax=Variovorax sp. PAMC26660 TaxID=2762322 RepID=UPI00164EC2ED|nr:hypothetical protein [Variovorax sp. PAMC26660]QNK66540.1 hypothetical protein H7F35_25620 [Variovorax sp. PAMC26660]